MNRTEHFLVTISLILLWVFSAEGKMHYVVVADSVTRMPLQSASVFDSNGNSVGVSNGSGRLPYVSAGSYPVTVRYLGYEERKVEFAGQDTIFLRENSAELPEIVVESPHHKALHMLAYIREYSTLTTYTDTVFLFREKMVDYMFVPDKKLRFKGWTAPRVIKSKSYYRFTDAQGLDSVSDACNHHFSWSDWVGVPPSHEIPIVLRRTESGTDTLCGKYSPTEVWSKCGDRMNVNVNVLADTLSRSWVPNLSVFFKKYIDFEDFRLRLNYDNVVGGCVNPEDITGYSVNIESRGRGHDMFMFHRSNEAFCVSTYAEVYMLDKEYITIKEAKKWEQGQFDDIDIYEPSDAPVLQPIIMALIERVNNVDKDSDRLLLAPDHRLVGRGVVKQHFGQRVLQLVKTLTGIARYRSQKKWNNQWKDFRKKQLKKNRSSSDD